MGQRIGIRYRSKRLSPTTTICNLIVIILQYTDPTVIVISNGVNGYDEFGSLTDLMELPYSRLLCAQKQT